MSRFTLGNIPRLAVRHKRSSEPVKRAPRSHPRMVVLALRIRRLSRKVLQ